MAKYDGWNRHWGRDKNGDTSAEGYFDSLSPEVKEELNRRANRVTSVEGLRRLGNQLENGAEEPKESSSDHS